MLLQQIIESNTTLSFSDIAKYPDLLNQITSIFNLEDKEYTLSVRLALEHFKIATYLTGGDYIGPTTARALLKLVHPSILGLTNLSTVESNAILLAQPLTTRSELCVLQAYPDPSTNAEPYTFGWGATKNLDNTDFYLGFTGSQELADKLLTRDLNIALENSKTVPNWSNFTLGQTAALIDFSYNTGYYYKAENFDTLNEFLTNKEYDKVPYAFNLYVNKGTPAEDGLKVRRQAEVDLWLKN